MARTCYRTLQVDESSEFDELDGDILNAFDFDFEHLYELITAPMTFVKTVLKILRKQIPQMGVKIGLKK